MFERPYLETIVKIVQDFLEEKIPTVYNSIIRWFNNEDELADKREEIK